MRVPVHPAVEQDRASQRKVSYEPSGAPVRCQLWDRRRLVAVVPVTLDDQGHPSDVTFNPTQVERITRLAFVYGGRVFAHPLGEPVVVRPGNPLRLALGHLKLLTRFGDNILKAGRV